MTVFMSTDTAFRADQMLTLWGALAMRHVALGAACACGTGGVSLRLDDFELDIVGYLEDVGQRSGMAEVVAFFNELQSSAPRDRDQPLRSLLEDIHQDRLPEAVADWLLSKVERTLKSFAELHGSGMRG